MGERPRNWGERERNTAKIGGSKSVFVKCPRSGGECVVSIAVSDDEVEEILRMNFIVIVDVSFRAVSNDRTAWRNLSFDELNIIILTQ